MDRRNIQLTEDGSHTISIPAKNITYHSSHGALQESMHVFIDCGLRYFMSQSSANPDNLHVFEMGLGTGLNALLTWSEAFFRKQKIVYHAVELYPLTEAEIQSLNYNDLISNKNVQLSAIHHVPWNELIVLDNYFSFIKIKEDIQQFTTSEKFNIIYFDAFDPNAQPELWTEHIFKKMFSILHSNSFLVTYCSKGTVQSAMKAAGFKIEKLKGPPGKREIIRATKPTPH